MPEAKTLKRAAADKSAGKSASTQAGEFVKQEIDHIRAGKHGARSAKQAIAIGLSEARRAGVKVKTGKSATTAVKKRARVDSAAAASHRKPSAERSRASETALKREPRTAASHTALARHARAAVPRARKTRRANAR